MEFFGRKSLIFVSIMLIGTLYPSEPQQKNARGWTSYFLSFFRKSTGTIPAYKPSVATVNITSQDDFFRKATPVSSSELYTLYRVYDEKALAKFSDDFIALCREYVTTMERIDPSKTIGNLKSLVEKVNEELAAAREKDVTTAQHFEMSQRLYMDVPKHESSMTTLRQLASRFNELALRHTPNDRCLCPTPEDSALQKVFSEIGGSTGIITKIEGTLLAKADRYAYERPKLYDDISKTMLECNSGRVLVEQLKNIIQQAITPNGVYAPMLRKAVAEVIDPYLQSTKGRCK
jgi:hypothetical protein